MFLCRCNNQIKYIMEEFDDLARLPYRTSYASTLLWVMTASFYTVYTLCYSYQCEKKGLISMTSQVISLSDSEAPVPFVKRFYKYREFTIDIYLTNFFIFFILVETLLRCLIKHIEWFPYQMNFKNYR